MTPLLIAGAGGLAREAAAAVAAVNRVRPTWELRGFLDDDPALHGTSRGGIPVVGPLSEIPDGASVLVCIGNPGDPEVRMRVVRKLGLPAERYATLVHPSVEVGSGCLIGHGSVLLAQSVLTADVTVGAHVAVMPHVVLTHDDVVEDFVTVAAGVRLGGNVHIGRSAYLGSGALVRQAVHIGPGALVGMGAVVLDDVPPGEVWVGNPARRLRSTVTKETQPHGSTAR